MAEIKFSSKAHRDFFVEMMGKCRKNDTYHRAFFYVMGIAPETRANINRMFDFKNDWIMPEGMHGGWQTSGTVRVCQLAFNLWNGYSGERQGDEFTPNDLFCCEFAPYFMEARSRASAWPWATVRFRERVQVRCSSPSTPVMPVRAATGWVESTRHRVCNMARSPSRPL